MSFRIEEKLKVAESKIFKLKDWITKNNFSIFIKKILFKFKKEIIIVAILLLVGIIFLI